VVGDGVPQLISLLDEFREGGFEASLITTFNAYLPFYESVVLRRLMAGGCRHNAVLMDAGQLSACLESAASRPMGAGYDYTLAPMPSAGAFHPKLLLLVGPKRVVTFVGSHNLTLSGFGLNRETTCKISATIGREERGADFARAAWRAVRVWLENSGRFLPRQTVQNILAIEDIAPWLREGNDSPEETRLLYQAPGSQSLWDQIRQLIPASVKRITVVGAFFDARCDFLTRVEAQFPKAKLYVGIEPKTVQMTEKGAGRIRGSWHDASKLTGSAGYLHAKLIYFETVHHSDVLAFGSANPSSPAWGLASSIRNEEMIVAWTGAKAREFANQLGISEVKDLPRISAKVLHQIDAAAANRQQQQSTTRGLTQGIAIITNIGVEILAEAIPGKAKSLDALDESGQVVIGPMECIFDGDFVRASLSEHLADRVRFIRITVRKGEQVLFICHHTERRDAAVRTGRQAQLRKALSSLEGDPADLATLISAVQNVVFGSHTIRSPGTPGSGGAAAPRPEETVTTLEGTADSPDKRRGRTRLATGDFGYLLQVLIYELGKSLPPATNGAGSSGRTEEEMENTDDESPTEPPNIEGDSDIAEACGRKVATLVNRMVRVLEEADGTSDNALTTIAQLTAVICTLRALRQLDRQDRWRRTGFSLVPEDCRFKLFNGILDSVIGGSQPLMRQADVIAAAHSMEVVHLRGLMIWLAWECKFRADKKFAFGDEIEDREYNVLQRAALLELVLPALPDADAREQAERSIQATATPSQTLRANQWVQTHFAWGRHVAQHAASIPKHLTQESEYPTAGSIVAITQSSGQTLYVVAGRDGEAVVLCDLRAENLRRSFLRKSLTCVAVP
jgi:hypothetical protein